MIALFDNFLFDGALFDGDIQLIPVPILGNFDDVWSLDTGEFTDVNLTVNTGNFTDIDSG
jgi:hypothetical protein